MVIFSAIVSAAPAQNKIYGFGQVKIDADGFSITKLCVFLKSPLDEGILVNVRYEFYFDFNSTGSPKLGFASLIFKSAKKWLPELIVGRTLDPLTYQFPAPFRILIIHYPMAAFNKPMDTGIFFREVYEGKIWAMAGIANGNGGFKDNNKSLDFTSRIKYSLPFGFQIGGVFRNGEQPDGVRQIAGGDLSWQSGRIWINGGQNVFDYNGRQIGRWLWSTFDVTNWLQLVGLVESLEINNEAATSGWTAGINFSPTPKTVIRLDLVKNKKQKTCWGVLFQQMF